MDGIIRKYVCPQSATSQTNPTEQVNWALNKGADWTSSTAEQETENHKQNPQKGYTTHFHLGKWKTSLPFCKVF